MRILHLLDHSVPRRSPYSLRTMSILQQQRALGWQTFQLTGPRQGPAAADANNSDWHFFRTEPAAGPLARWPLTTRLATLNALAQRLHAVVRLTRPDILHAHASGQNGIAALRVGRALGLPVVFEAAAGWSDPRDGMSRTIARLAETYVARRADAVTTNSDALRIDLRERGVARVTVVPDAVNLDRLAPVPPRDGAQARRLGIEAGPVIGYVGPFYAHEGLSLLIDAMPAMLSAVPTLRLLLVGAGPEEAALRRQVAQMGLNGKVIFSGPVARRHNPQYHSLIELLVYPRLPAPLANLVPAIKPLEAMALGHMVAASNVGSHRELIQHGRTGFLFQAGSAQALSEAVLRLLAERGCWPGMRNAARWFVEYERTWHTSVARYAPLYDMLLTRRRRR